MAEYLNDYSDVSPAPTPPPTLLDCPVRNVTKNEDGSIECEIDHWEFGWMSYTAAAGDSQSAKLHAKLLVDHPNMPATPIHVVVVTGEMVKQEARRRILAIAPDWKQRNLNAEQAALLKKGEANWDADETARWSAAEAIWIQINAVRAASNTIEALDPIPDDYTDDKHWSAS